MTDDASEKKCSNWFTFAAGVRMDSTVKQLALICIVACLCLGLAWAHEADFFAIFFAAAAVISGEEAVRRSL